MAGSYLKCDTVLDIPYTSFPDLLKRRAVETPNKAACVFFYENNERYVLAFGDLYDRATKFAKALVQMGVKKGDIIGVSGRNVPEWLVAYFGVQMAGGCSLCLPFQQNETQIIALLKSIGDVKLLIIDAGTGGQNCQYVKNILDESLESGDLDSGKVLGLQQVILFNHNEALPSLYNVVDMCSQDVGVDLPRIDPEDMAIILLSSGSTGLPKAIPYSQHALVIFACHCVNVYQTNNEDAVFYNDRAFFWAAGHPCWEIGGGKTRVTMTNALHTSSMADAVETACKIMTREKATQAFLVPSVLDLIIKNGFPLKIQRISTGSMVVKSSMLECIGKICDEFQNIYGTTELALIGSRIYTVNDKPLVNQGVVSCRPDPGVEVKVTDDEGFVQPIGQRGKIWIRTIRRFTGYLNHTFSPELTEYIIRSGWFSHDDGGYVTKDNSLIIEGRNQEMIEVLGRKIYPIEIEDVIKSKSNVIAAIVVPIKERETGHFVPSAAVVYRPQGEDSVESMQRYLRKQFNITAEDHLNEYLYVPSVIISVKEFPILANGKPNRKAVSQLIFDKIDSQRYDTS